jgi:hypothetical protein
MKHVRIPPTPVSTHLCQFNPLSTVSRFSLARLDLCLGHFVCENTLKLPLTCYPYSSNHSSPPMKPGFLAPVHNQYQSTAQAYDKSILQKLDARMGSERTTSPQKLVSTFGSVDESSSTSNDLFQHHRPFQPKVVCLPITIRRPNRLDRPLAKWAGKTTAMSLGNNNSRSRTQRDNFYPRNKPADYCHGSQPHTRGDRTVRDDAPQNICHQRISPVHDASLRMEETGLRHLRIGDYSSRRDPCSPAGQVGRKRRASSPPGEVGSMPHSLDSAGDLYTQRESTMTSPSLGYRFLSGSESSATWHSRSFSQSSRLSLGGSSMASMDIHSCQSPRDISPATTDSSDSPHPPSLSKNNSLGESPSSTNPGQALSGTKPLMISWKVPDNIIQSKQSIGPDIQDILACRCCPKKPMVFDSRNMFK